MTYYYVIINDFGMGFLRGLFNALLVLVCSAQTSLASELGDLLKVLEGEYNNNEQVWQQELDGGSGLAKQHWTWSITSENSLSLSVAQGQSSSAAQLMFEFSATQEGVHSNVRLLDGRSIRCSYAWTRAADGFEAHLQQDASCANLLPSRWQIDREFLTITPPRRTGNEPATVLRARRVTYYSGWIALSRSSIEETAADDDYIFLSKIRAHDEGSITSILDDGEPTGYAVELARLTYQNTKVAVLKLGIIEEATGKTLAYSWSGPGSELIGINLRWVQCGFTRM